MVFKYCKKCIGMRQFLPDPIYNIGYIVPKHCDICGVEE